jgi:hypothetical protein
MRYLGAPFAAHRGAEPEVLQGELLWCSAGGERRPYRPEQIGELVGLEHGRGHPGNSERSEVQWLTRPHETSRECRHDRLRRSTATEGERRACTRRAGAEHFHSPGGNLATGESAVLIAGAEQWKG